MDNCIQLLLSSALKSPENIVLVVHEGALELYRNYLEQDCSFIDNDKQALENNIKRLFVYETNKTTNDSLSKIYENFCQQQNLKPTIVISSYKPDTPSEEIFNWVKQEKINLSFCLTLNQQIANFKQRIIILHY